MEKKSHAAGVRSVALFEAFKGAIVLIVGFELLHYLHRDLEAIAEDMVRASHLNPARHFPHVFIEAARNTTDARLKSLAAMAFVYSGVRFVEAYGLWRLKAWAEWFAIVSGSIYVPLEIYELSMHATIIRASVLIINIVIVAYLIHVRRASRTEEQVTVAASPSEP